MQLCLSVYFISLSKSIHSSTHLSISISALLFIIFLLLLSVCFCLCLQEFIIALIYKYWQQTPSSNRMVFGNICRMLYVFFNFFVEQRIFSILIDNKELFF